MIVVDIETSGVSKSKSGIWQIGAIELENPSNTFLEEARIDDEDEVSKEALLVIGKDEEYLRDKKKQSQKEMLENFFAWASKISNRIFAAHIINFDLEFISAKSEKYGLKMPFGYRGLDLHALAMMKYFQINGSFMVEKGLSSMGLDKVLEFCGIKDERVNIKNGNVAKEGKPHNGLEDAKLEAECFSRIIFGKNLLDEFLSQDIPEYLLKK